MNEVAFWQAQHLRVPSLLRELRAKFQVSQISREAREGAKMREEDYNRNVAM